MSRTAKRKVFDPWTATLETAEQAAEAEHFEIWQHSPVFQWQAARRVLEREAAVKAGDSVVLLGCVRDCLEYGLVAPKWLVDAYSGRYDRVAGLHVASWDEAFGRPFPKRRRIDRAKVRREKIGPVYLAVKTRHEAGERMDKELFESVATEHNINGTMVEELYYMAQKAVDAFVTGLTKE